MHDKFTIKARDRGQNWISYKKMRLICVYNKNGGCFSSSRWLSSMNSMIESSSSPSISVTLALQTAAGLIEEFYEGEVVLALEMTLSQDFVVESTSQHFCEGLSLDSIKWDLKILWVPKRARERVTVIKWQGGNWYFLKNIIKNWKTKMKKRADCW